MGEKNLRFSTEVAFYLGNGVIYIIQLLLLLLLLGYYYTSLLLLCPRP